MLARTLACCFLSVLLLLTALPLYAAPAQTPTATAPATPPRDWWETWTTRAVLIDLDTHFLPLGHSMKGNVQFKGDDAFWKELTAEDAHRAAAATEKQPALPTALVRVVVERITDEKSAPDAKGPKRVAPARWAVNLPIHGRKMEFTVPATALAQTGVYRVQAYLLRSPTASTAFAIQRRFGEFENEFAQPPTVTLTVRPPRDPVIPSVVTDAPALLKEAVRIGDPNRQRFPQNNDADCYARGVRDLYAFHHRLFVGCGDWGANRGPIDIWTYMPPDKKEGKGQWFLEFTVDDESIDRFREWNDRLYVPGIDAREDFSFGNVYVRADNRWSKWRTVPHAVHVLDVASWYNVLYACCGVVEPGNSTITAGLYGSIDGGQTWQRCRASNTAEESYAFRFFEATPLQERLLVFDNFAKQGLWEWDGQNLRHREVDLFPGATGVWYAAMVENAHRFANGVLYSRGGDQRPLYYLEDLNRGAMRIQAFDTGSGVADIVVDRTGVCQVLTRRRLTDGWEGAILTSTDLRHWTRIALFHVPAPPSALACLEDTYYVGLGSDGTNPASGTVWEIR